MARGRDPGFAVIVKLTDRFTKPLDSVNRKIAESTARVRGIMAVPGAIMRSAGLDKIGGAFANVGKSFLNLRNSVTGLLGPLTRMGAVMAGFELGRMVHDSISLGGELIKLSRNTGLAVEDLQRLQYAANQSGVGTEEFNGMLMKLAKTMRDARKDTKGTSEAFKAMKAAGVDMQGLQNGTVKLTDVFYKFADAVHDTTDEVVQGAFAVAGFGRSGQSTIAFLGEGSDEIRRLGTEAAVMSEKTARSAKAFGDVVLKMTQHIKDLSYQILERLLPGMTGGAEATDKWMEANKPWIIREVVGTVENLITVGRRLFEIINNDIVPAVKRLEPVWRAFEAVVGPANAKLIAFFSVVAPGVIGALFGITKAVVALGFALVANPIGAAIIAIGAVIAGVAYLIWRNWDSITKAFGDAKDSITNILGILWDNIVAAPRLIAGDFTAAVLGLWEGIPDGVRGFIDDTIGVVSSMAARFTETTVALFNLPLTLVNAAWDAMPEGVRGFLTRIAGTISGAAGALRTAIVETLTAPIAFVMEKWEALVGWISGAVGRISGVFGRIGGLFGGGGEAANRSPNQILGGTTTPQATGGAWAQPLQEATSGGGGWAAMAQQASRSEVTVNFENMPAGVRVAEGRSTGNTEVNINQTYAGMPAPAGAM